MQVDELIFSHREFLKELHALCKKWNAKIGGCGCCGSPWVIFSDDTSMEELDVNSQYLYGIMDGETVTLKDTRHIIRTFQNDDGWNAGCKVCGTYARGHEIKEEAIKALEEKPCK